MSAVAQRQPISPQLTRDAFPHLTLTEYAELSALERDLDQLCREGLLEEFRDDDNVLRFRPTGTAH